MKEIDLPLEYPCYIGTDDAKLAFENPQLLNQSFGDKFGELSQHHAETAMDGRILMIRGELTRDKKTFDAEILVMMPSFARVAINKVLFLKEPKATVNLYANLSRLPKAEPIQPTPSTPTVWRAKTKSLSVEIT